jgi:undecaprenyl-diphosphatase
VVLATIPIGLVGLLVKDTIATWARNPTLVATTLIVFGLLLWAADRYAEHRRPLAALGWRDAILVGMAQAVALIPGTSRSGITLTAGLSLGFTREAAARFSFLMSIPVGVLAGLLDLRDMIGHPPAPEEITGLLLGVVVSAVTAFAVIHGLLAWLRQHGMGVFVVYRVILGLVILWWADAP